MSPVWSGSCIASLGCMYGARKKSCDRTALLACLASAGIRPRPFDANAASGDGIICIGQLNEEVCEFVREHTRNHEGGCWCWKPPLRPRTARWSGSCCTPAHRTSWRGPRPRTPQSGSRLVSNAGRPSTSCPIAAGPGQAGRRQRRVAAVAAPDRRGGPLHLRLRAAHRRERHRQGAGRAADP